MTRCPYKEAGLPIGVLPPAAQAKLKAAAAIPEGGDRFARIRALAEADAWCKENYPQFFRKDV